MDPVDLALILALDGSASVTYEEFGRRFFEVAVTPERVAAALADIAGSEFAMEPIAQGPGGIAKVSANVQIKDPRVTRRLGDLMGIHKALRYMFTDPARGYAWVRASNLAFGGRSALDRMLAGAPSDIAAVRAYLDAERSAW